MENRVPFKSIAVSHHSCSSSTSSSASSVKPALTTHPDPYFTSEQHSDLFTSDFEKGRLHTCNSLIYDSTTTMIKDYDSSPASESPGSQYDDGILDNMKQVQHNHYHHPLWQPDSAHSSRTSSFSLDNSCHQTLRMKTSAHFELSRYLAPSITTRDIVASLLPANTYSSRSNSSASSNSSSRGYGSQSLLSGIAPTIFDGLQIRVAGVPDKSRVETQARLCIQLVDANGTKVTQWPCLKLPERLLSRSRLKRAAQEQRQQHQPQRSRPSYLDGNGNGVGGILLSDESKVVYLDAKVVCATQPDRPVKMCSACIQRERKRAERSKNSHSRRALLDGLAPEQDRILLFNCGPVANFSSGDTILPTRIACYCRHHNEKVGFCIQFTMRTHKGAVVATGTSAPILITDDHKSVRQRKRSRPTAVDLEIPSDTSSSKSPCITLPVTPTPSRQGSLSPLAPLSDPMVTDPHGYALPTPCEERRFSACLPLPSSYAEAYHLSQQCPIIIQKTSAVAPQLDRLVPAQGPMFGGTEVTVLGSGFYNGLTCLFGEHAATTIYWNPNTLVCVLPPTLQPGPVVVSFKQHSIVLDGARGQDIPLFTYQDNNDHSLLELALQVVGLKSTGRLQDPKQVAMRIVQQAGGSFLAKP